jgi:DNA-directed RNA polymerase subunit F
MKMEDVCRLSPEDEQELRAILAWEKHCAEKEITIKSAD